MRRHEYLFSKGHLRDALEHQEKLLVQEVEGAPEEHLLAVDEAAWVGALVDRYRVEAPVLRPDEWSMDRAEEIKVDVSHDSGRAIFDRTGPFYVTGFRVVVRIPFTGDKGVFELQPSSFTFNLPFAIVAEGEIRDVIEYPHDAPVDIKAHTQKLVSSVEQYLGSARNDIAQFNESLEKTARRAIQARRERVRTHYEHLAATGIPIRETEGSPKTYIADAIVRRPTPALPHVSTSAPMPLEPVLSDEVFEHILGVIRSTGQDMERSPKTYAGMGEEDLRQVIVAMLNTHYGGQAVAEAFNVSGKTDILVRHEGKNLFIGECKFWSGAKGLSEAVDQLFGYVAWRDTKLALVMFVRERNLTSVVETARGPLERHAQFLEWRESDQETELRARMTWPGDERRHADLNVFFVHIPAQGTRKPAGQ